jgi:hypothetical protein
LVSLALLLAGCPSAPAPDVMSADERRIAFMREEPLLARDKEPLVKPGFLVSDRLAAHRNLISARIADQQAQNASEVARKQTADAMLVLREGKWSVYLAACLPPGTGPDNPDDVVGYRYEDGWAYAVYAYKIADGVSYSAELLSSGRGSRAHVALRLVAPHSSEPRADLFPDRPRELEAGKSCVEVSLPPEDRVVSGEPTLMDTQGPDPRGGAKPTGRR